jgi:signal transduction histidine kinase
MEAAAILVASAACATVIASGSRIPAPLQFAAILGTWLLALTAVIVLHWRERSCVAAATSRLMIDAQEQERARIARELHDDIAQRLSLLTIALAAESRELQEEAAGIAADVQSLSRELHVSHVETPRTRCKHSGVLCGVQQAATRESSVRH